MSSELNRKEQSGACSYASPTLCVGVLCSVLATGSHALSASEDGTTKIWDAGVGVCKLTLTDMMEV